jgi:hypothetical protein
MICAKIVANASSMIPNIDHATRSERRVQADDTKKSSKHVRPQKDTLVDLFKRLSIACESTRKMRALYFVFCFLRFSKGSPVLTLLVFSFLFYITFLTREKEMIPLLPPTPPPLFTAFVLLGGTSASMKEGGKEEEWTGRHSFLCWPLFNLRPLLSLCFFLVVLLLIGHEALDIFLLCPTS